MIELVVLIDACVIVGLIGIAIHQRNRWPEPTTRPFGCAACGVDYSDARAAAWHQQGQHVETYDALHGSRSNQIPEGT